MSEVKQTNNYKMFKLIKGNREVSNGHVNRLVASISVNNRLEFCPILVNASFEVLDGQHRLMAAKKLNLPIFYREVGNAGLSDVQLLNTNNTNWYGKDFLNSYIARGFKEYKVLQAFCNSNGFTIANALFLLQGPNDKRQKESSTTLDFRSGNLNLGYLSYANEMSKMIHDLDDYREASVINDRDFIISLQIMYQKIKPEDFLAKLEDSGWKIEKQANRRSYLRRFEEILNYKQKVKTTRLY